MKISVKSFEKCTSNDLYRNIANRTFEKKAENDEVDVLFIFWKVIINYFII